MDNLKFKNVKEIDQEQLQQLFTSVKWNSAKYPNRLQKAIENSHLVITVWDNNDLVALVSTISDGYINVFVTYLVVKPNYQNQGLGTKLMNKVMKYYDGFGNRILTTEEEKEKYYNKFNFEKDGISMFSIDWKDDNIE